MSEVAPAAERRVPRFFRECVWPYAPLLAEIGLCMALGVLLSLADPLILKAILDRAVGDGDFALLSTLVALLFGVLVFRSAFRVLSYGLSSYAGLRILFDLRRRAFEHVMRLSPYYFRGERTGDILARLSYDIDVLQRAAVHSVVNALQDSLTLVGIFAALAWIDWPLALVLLAFCPLLAAGLAWINRGLRRESGRARSAVADLFAFLEERLVALRVIQEFRRERAEARAHVRVSRPWIERNLNLSVLGAWQVSLADALTTGAFILVFLVGGWRALQGALSIGSLVAFYTLASRLYRPISGLIDVNIDLQQAGAALERVYELLDTAPQVPEPRQPKDPAPAAVRGGVRVEGARVAFDGKVVLDSIDVEIHAGETVAWVGPSGSGKSTLAALVARHVDPQVGRVWLEGVDAREWSGRGLRAAVGLVAQETVLFHASLADNLRVARRRASADELWAVLEAVDLRAWCERLPAGLDADVGEGGMKLSGGERQRVALARALLKDPPLLILDEATSALDPSTERRVLQGLRACRRGRTTVVIAHRLSSLTDVDRIVVLRAGRVVESGGHGDLLARAGLYRSLWDDQSRHTGGDAGPATA